MSPILQALALQSLVTLAKPAAVRAAAPPPAGKPVYLDFDMQLQRKSKWCWAATSVSVSLYYNSTSSWTQCSVAAKALGGFGCCFFLLGWTCNRNFFLDKALSVTGNFVSGSGTLYFDAIEEELLRERVIGARVEWRGGNGHFMAIHGCRIEATMNVLEIDDPIYGKSSVAERVFLSSYLGRGSWTHSYHTKP